MGLKALLASSSHFPNEQAVFALQLLAAGLVDRDEVRLALGLGRDEEDVD